MQNKRVVVTGGAGFIGSHIVDLLIELGYEIFIIDNMTSGRRDNLISDAFIGYLNICDNRIPGIIKEFDPFAIIHQAAQPSLRASIDDPLLDAETNILGTINVVQAAKLVGARVVFASTSAVYDTADKIPFKEKYCVAPNLPYGIAKASAEMYIRESGISYAILRYGNVYGPRQIPVGENQLVPHCLNHLLHGERFVINGDGNQERDFVYVGDIAKANLLAMESDVCNTFNCGYGIMTTVNHVCDSLARIALGGKHIFIHGPAKPGEMRQSCLDSKFAKNFLEWEATTSLQAGLKNTVEWARSQK